jgi:hypothetical protein
MIPIALLLAGCDPQTLKGSVAGGECRVFERPPYAVRGQRQYDQNWIDSQVEGGVGACGWPRPAARPAAIDAATLVAPAPAPVRRRGVIARIKAVVHRQPVAPPAAVPAIETAAPPMVPSDPESIKPPEPPRRRTPLELLLDKSGPAVHGATP